MSLEEIVNYRRISERVASSGQPEEMQFKGIAQAGFEVVINLAMPNSDNAIPEEGYIVTARKMHYLHIPVPFENPGIEQVEMFFAAMQAFQKKRCWIHCVVNMRVSAFLYLYHKLVLGESDDVARRVMIPDWQPDQIWQKLLQLKPNELILPR